MNFGAYDTGASQFGGGGFMPSPAPGAGNQYGGGGGQKKQSQQTSLRAFTIKHLLKNVANAEDDACVVDGHDVSTVTIVGKVTSVQELATRVMLNINDGTGSLEACHWIDIQDQDLMGRKRSEWQQGRYVRVFGNLKSFEGKRSITAFAIKPVTDHNEVTYHFLQCIMQHLHLTKGAPPTGAAPGQAPGQGMGGRTPPPAGVYGAPVGGHMGGGAPVVAPLAAGGGDINSDVKAVFNLPQAVAAANGMSVEAALGELRRMGRNYTIQQIMQSCEYLAAEGVLYSTINDSTYKSTGAC